MTSSSPSAGSSHLRLALICLRASHVPVVGRWLTCHVPAVYLHRLRAGSRGYETPGRLVWI